MESARGEVSAHFRRMDIQDLIKKLGTPSAFLSTSHIFLPPQAPSRKLEGGRGRLRTPASKKEAARDVCMRVHTRAFVL